MIGLAVMVTVAGHAGSGAGDGGRISGSALRVASGALATGVLLGWVLGYHRQDTAL